MKLTISCSYCGDHILVRLVDFTAARRVNKVAGPIRCNACGSTTQLVLSTKRVRQGKKYKAIVQAAHERMLVELDARRESNRIAGDALVAQPGCTCGPEIERRAEHGFRGASEYYGRDSGHPLSTGWSRDKTHDALMPTEPRHLHGCPNYKRSESRHD